MQNGMIYDIQRFSFVDGPGIRTTVFLKGCNLRCKWCHNPEGISSKPQLLFYKSKCTGCGCCVKICPNNLKKCDVCGKCAELCPSKARVLCGKKYNTDEVFAEILKDINFYKNSDGGVTFSGGESMLQVDFLAELLEKCRNVGIHTAVDTAGNVPWNNFEKVLPFTNLFLYDVKSFSPLRHLEGTGTTNELILENLKKLSALADITVRIPLIPGFNDCEEEMKEISVLLKTLKISKVDVLPYHKMGEIKYDALGLPKREFRVPDETEIQLYKSIFKNQSKGAKK